MVETLDMTMEIHQELEISASMEIVFASVLKQLGPANEHPDGTPMPLVLEAWPGGRWFRDLEYKTGHFWGHVQVIKPPTLIEICGPLFMSYPAINHVKYRLTQQPGGTRLTFTHRGIGNFDPQHIKGATTGWNYILTQIKQRSESGMTS